MNLVVSMSYDEIIKKAQSLGIDPTVDSNGQQFESTSNDAYVANIADQLGFDRHNYNINEIAYRLNEMEKSNTNNNQNQNAKNLSDATKLAAEGLATAYGGKLGGAAVKAFSKTNLGKKTFEKAGNTLDRMDSIVKHPLGIVNPNANNKEENSSNNSELDKPDELTNNDSLPNNNIDSNDNKKDSKKNNSFLNNFKNNKKKNNEGNLLDFGKNFKKKIKLWAIIGSGFLVILLLIFLVVIFGKDNAILDLTGSIYQPTEKGNDGDVASGYSIRYIEKSMLYVGDSRILDMQKYIQSNNVNFIGVENADYNWLISQGRALINSKINEEGSSVKYVIIGLGLYDLDNADKYVNLYRSLMSNNKKITYIFMSVNPVIDGKAPSSMTNKRITNFNNRLKVKLGTNYVDTNTSIGRNFNSSDGIKYDGSIYRLIHSNILSYIREHFRHGFLEEYPHGTEGTELLQDNIITVIGQSAYNNIDNAVKTGVEKSGICNKESSAIAGINLAYGLYELGYRVPYYWNGGHDMHDIGGESAYVNYHGVERYLGSSVAESCSPTTCYNHYGYDCTGFVNWAVSTAMGKDISTSLDGWFSRSTGISLGAAESGDLVLMEGHAILVIENKGDYLQTLESTGGNNGLIFRTYNAGELESLGASVYSLTPYFEQECA